MKVFMIDNNIELCQSMKEMFLAKQDVEFDYSDNLEDGLECIDGCSMIILDGKGYLSSKEKTEHAAHAIRGISSIRERNKEAQIIIYTGFLEEVDKFILGTFKEKIDRYKKEIPPEEMVEIIMGRLKNSMYYNLRSKYDNVFKIFEEYITDDKGEYKERITVLLSILEGHTDWNDLNFDAKDGVANSIRKIIETVYHSINYHFANVIPGDVINGRFSIGTINRYMTDEDSKYMCSVMDNLTKTAYHNTGNFKHKLNDKEQGFITEYGIKSLIFGVLELLTWYEHGIQSGNFAN